MPMLGRIFSSAVNHLLRTTSWAREELKPFAGRTAQFHSPPAGFALTVLESGDVIAASAADAADVVITIAPGLLPRILARDETAWTEVAICGDTDFARVIHHLAYRLQWDVEEDLSRVLGDIAAHRLVRTGRTLEEWGRQSVDNLSRSFAEYWTEEQPLLARPRDVGEFNRDVDALRDDAARFEKRVEIYLKRRAGAKPPA